jgi:hypothetical protein
VRRFPALAVIRRDLAYVNLLREKVRQLDAEKNVSETSATLRASSRGSWQLISVGNAGSIGVIVWRTQ